MSEFGVAVLGAGGTIAPAIVRDLAESEEVGSLLLRGRTRTARRASTASTPRRERRWPTNCPSRTCS